MNQVFGVPPSNVPQPNGFNLFPPQQGGGGAFFGGSQQQHTPLGNLAAFKGDLVYPVFTIGFFIVGVVVVVKVLLALLGLLAAKLFHGVVPRSLDELLERKRRSIDNETIDQEKLDGLTSVIMAALDSQQCQQRMMCELGTYVQKYDTNNLIAGIAERLVPEDYLTQVKAFKSGGHCDEFVCGRPSSQTEPSQVKSTSTKDVEGL